MRITSVSARNFLNFDERGVEVEALGDVTLLVGPNGSGKTSFLRVFDFMSLAMSRVSFSPGPYVHMRDSSRNIELVVGVLLSEPERRLAVTGLLMALEREVNTGGHKQDLNGQLANLAIHQVLQSSADLVEKWFSSVIRFHAATFHGPRQDMSTWVTFATPGGPVTLTNQDHLVRSPKEDDTSWSADLSSSIFRRLQADSPEAFQLHPPPFEIPDGLVARVASTLGPSTIAEELAPRAGRPVGMMLEALKLAGNRSWGPYTPSPEELELEVFVKALGYNPLNTRVGFSQLLARIFQNGVHHLGEARVKLASLGADHPWVSLSSQGGVLNQDLPERLFMMKNSTDGRTRDRFWEIVAAVHGISEVDIDVAFEERQVAAQDEKPSGDRTSVALLTFRENGMSYPGSLAAAGHCELVSILTEVIGPTESTILLDEPALNLHPTKQRQLFRSLIQLASNAHNQLFLVTHSPAFIQGENLPNTFRFSVTRGTPRLKRLAQADRRADGRIEKLLQADPEVSAALFAQRVILVEGHDEAAGLPIWLAKCSPDAADRLLNVMFINVGGQTSFPSYADTLKAWGVPFFLIGDSQAKEITEPFAPNSCTYPFADYVDICDQYCRAKFEEAKDAWGGGPKNPLVARTVARECEPPPPIVDIWERLQPFLREGSN